MTSPRIYLPVPSLEDPNHYRPGGYHPVHLNDTFHHGRYQVTHKLGHGTYATVWLVKDKHSGRYASLKLLTASASGHERVIVERLRLCKSGHARGADYVINVLDNFIHVGPNGAHLGIVSEVLGPKLSSDIEEVLGTEAFPLGFVKRMASQISQGLAYLHSCGIVHGDLHPGNILMYSQSMAEWSSSDIETYYGTPETRQLALEHGREPPAPSPHVPNYLVYPAEQDALLRLCLSSSPHVKICDFGESFIWKAGESLPRKLNIPFVYAAPEVLFNDAPDPKSDVWALAVLFYFIFSGGSLLFPTTADRVDVLPGIVYSLGRLPSRWWTKWEDRSKYFNEEGKWIGEARDLSNLCTELVRFSRPMDEEEKVSLENLLRKMVKYEPEERVTSGDVVQLIPESWFENTTVESALAA